MFSQPSSLYAAHPPMSPKTEQMLANTLLPGSKTKKGRSELVSLRSKLWDAQKLTRIILGRECIELDNKDILKAIREVAEMKQELKSLRKQARKYRRLQARVAREKKAQQQCEEAPEPSPMAIDSEEDLDSVEFWSSCRQASQGKVDVATEKVPNPPSQPQPIGAELLSGLEAKVKSWQARFDCLGKDNEGTIQKCQEDVREMYYTLQQIEDLQHDPQKLAEVRVELVNLVDTMSSFPTQAKMQGLDEAARAYQTEEDKLRRALDSALEENRSLRDINSQLSMSKELEKSPPKSQKEPHVKTKLASRFMKKLRRVYRKDANNSSPGNAHKVSTIAVQTTNLIHPKEQEATSSDGITEDCHNERFEDSVESLGPLDEDGSCASADSLGSDFDDTIHTKYYDVPQEKMEFL